MNILVLVFLHLACNSQGQREVQIIDSEELKSLQMKGAVVVDVRTSGEFLEGHIPNAKNVELSDSFAASLETYDKGQPVILYCRSGRRSTNASEQLLEAGFKEVYNYKGSFNDWSSKGEEIEINK